MLWYWKVLVPVISVSTVGAVSYPFVYRNGNNTFFNPTNLNNQFSIHQTELLRDKEDSADKDIFIDSVSSHISALSTFGSTNKHQQVNRLSVSQPSLDLTMQNDGLPAAISQIVNGIQKEISRGESISEISETQMKEFQDAVDFVENSKQGIGVVKEIIEKYKLTDASKGKINVLRTLQEINDQQFSKKHRASIYDFYTMYNKLSNYKEQSLDKLEEIVKNTFSIQDSSGENLVSAENVEQNLLRINWKENEILIFKDEDNKDNWGWGNWNDNPYSAFYSREELWREKVQMIKVIEEIYKSNNYIIDKNKYPSLSSKGLETLKTLKKGEKSIFEQLIRGYKSEIELDIAVALLKYMKQIQETRKRRR